LCSGEELGRGTCACPLRKRRTLRDRSVLTFLTLRTHRRRRLRPAWVRTRAETKRRTTLLGKILRPFLQVARTPAGNRPAHNLDRMHKKAASCPNTSVPFQVSRRTRAWRRTRSPPQRLRLDRSTRTAKGIRHPERKVLLYPAERPLRRPRTVHRAQALRRKEPSRRGRWCQTRPREGRHCP
jgi:hypothetical protein